MKFLRSKSGKTCLLNEPGVVEALQPLADMYQAGISPSVEVTSTSSGDDMFMSGKIAMVTAGVWKISTYTNITSFNWDVVQLPLDPNTGKRRCSSNVIGLIINPNTKNLEAAIKLLEQVVQPKMYRKCMQKPTQPSLHWNPHVRLSSTKMCRKILPLTKGTLLCSSERTIPVHPVPAVHPVAERNTQKRL